MPRKEQITITLDPELTRRLREKAQKSNSSLSSVIEKYLQSVDCLSGKTDIQRVLEILGDIKEAVAKNEDEKREAAEAAANAVSELSADDISADSCSRMQISVSSLASTD